jgi:Gas vesicle protein
MSDSAYTPRRAVPHGVVRADLAPPPSGPSSLADVLERVLDKGIVIAGDIQVNLLDIELLTIKIRLLVASVDRAKEMGINWWEGDPTLTSNARELERENGDLRARLDRLEARLAPAAETHERLEAAGGGHREEGGRARASAGAGGDTAAGERPRRKTTETRP